jgi:type II secretory pathway pseudopilin PulG
MTLVELLITVTIVTLLMAVSIPLVRSTLEGDKLRESSRQLNMMLTQARARAIERGRPVGVWFQRLMPQNPNACSELYFAESPPPYYGDVNGATAYLVDDPSIPAAGSTDPLIPLPGEADTICFDARSSLFASYAIPGDIIRFNRSSHYFVLLTINATATTLNIGGGVNASIAGTATFKRIFRESVIPSRVNLAATTPAEGVPFEVLRHPKKLNNAPLQLADGTVVDLAFSGIGAEGIQFAYRAAPAPPSADHVIIAFDARGALSYAFFDNAPQDVDGPVHFLLGTLDQLDIADSTPDMPNPITYDARPNSPAIPYDKNLANLASLWVTVGSRNGTVTTAENAFDLRPGPPATAWAGLPGPPYFTNTMRRCREFAQATDAIGGR